MALSEAEQRAMIGATHEIALEMVDELQHIREVLGKPQPTPGDTRRSSKHLWIGLGEANEKFVRDG